MAYLIGQIFEFLLVALGLGLFLGWLTWGLALRPRRDKLIQGDTLNMQLARAKIEMERQAAVISTLRKRVSECEREIAEKNRRIHALEPYIIELAELEDQIEVLRSLPGAAAAH